MNCEATRSFATEWPALERQLHGSLARRRIPMELREDIVQETGLRLFRNWHRIDPDRPVWPFAFTIALNLVRDEVGNRARRRQEVLPEEKLADDDTEECALARIELARVSTALHKLSLQQRSVLLAEVGPGYSEHENTPAAKMMRMRARRRLKAIMEQASGWVAPGVLGWRRISRKAHELASRMSLTEGLQALSSTGVCLLCMATVVGVMTAPNASGSTAVTVPKIGFAESGAGGERMALPSIRLASAIRPDGVAIVDAGASRPASAPRPDETSDWSSIGVGEDGVHVGGGEQEVGPDGFYLRQRARVKALRHRISADIRARQRVVACDDNPVEPSAPCVQPGDPKARGMLEIDRRRTKIRPRPHDLDGTRATTGPDASA